MLRRYVTAVVGRPKLVIALVVAVTLLLGFFITRLKVLLDVDQQIPPGHPLVIVGQRIDKLFGGKYMTVIGFYPKAGTIYTPSILGKVKRVTEALEKIPGVKPGSVLSLMSPRVKDVHSTEDALEITPLAGKVPQNDAEIAAFRERVKANAFLTSLFVSDDGRATAVLVDFEDFMKAGGPPHLYGRLEAIVAPEREDGLGDPPRRRADGPALAAQLHPPRGAAVRAGAGDDRLPPLPRVPDDPGDDRPARHRDHGAWSGRWGSWGSSARRWTRGTS